MTLPVAVEAARLSAELSVRLTSAPVNPTVPPKELAAFCSVMLVPVKLAFPAAVRAPVWEMAPLLVRVMLPDALLAAITSGLPSLIATLAPVKAMVPPKLLAVFCRVISVPVSVVLPIALRVPVWVIAPALERARVPVAVEAAMESGVPSASATLAPVKATVPPNEFAALDRVISTAFRVVFPPAVSAPVCARSSPTRFSVPVAELAARTRLNAL